MYLNSDTEKHFLFKLELISLSGKPVKVVFSDKIIVVELKAESTQFFKTEHILIQETYVVHGNYPFRLETLFDKFENKYNFQFCC